MKSKYIIVLLLMLSNILNYSCKLDTLPTEQVSSAVIYNNLGMLGDVLNAAYTQLKDEVPGWGYNCAIYFKVMSTAYGQDINVDPNPAYGNGTPPQYANWYLPQSYDPTNYASVDIWTHCYSVIYKANTILDNIDKVAGDQSQKDAVKGQALIIRARMYFELVRYYQHTYIIAKSKPGVPLVLNSTIQTSIARSTVSDVYTSITNDLTSAETLLTSWVRPSLAYYDVDVARFLLANVYLTMNDWVNAQNYANKISSKYPLMTIDEYQAGFTKINEEWVLGYTQTLQDFTTDNLAAIFDYGQDNTQYPDYEMYPASGFVSLMQGDPRGLFMPHPTKANSYATTKFYEHNSAAPYGDFIDMRAAEMYLVEAEAACRQGNTSTALSLLNTIQNARPGAAVTNTSDQATLLQSILLERRKEFYGEGLDYYDIKRLQLPIVRTMAYGNTIELSLPANTNILTIMIPQQEMENNPLIVQNPNPASVPVFTP